MDIVKLQIKFYINVGALCYYKEKILDPTGTLITDEEPDMRQFLLSIWLRPVQKLHSEQMSPTVW